MSAANASPPRNALPLPTAVRPEVWIFRLDQPVDETVLGADEITRVGAFRFDRDGRRFRRRRAHLRHVLSAYTGCAPSQVPYAVNRFGKPRLDLPRAPGFSASSSGEIGAVAVTAPGSEIGFDLEGVRPSGDEFEVAARLFAPEEAAAVRDAADFFRCWSRKEAYVKAVGEGLSMPLTSFAVEVHDTRRPRLLRADRRPGDLISCSLTDLSGCLPTVAGAFAATLVAFRPVERVIMRGNIVIEGE